MRKNLLFTVAAILALQSCNKNELENFDSKQPAIELDYRYLTLNVKGSLHDGSPSISFMHKNSTMLLDQFMTANDSQIREEPNCATQIGEKLYIGTGAGFNPGSCGISIVDANTLKQEHLIDLGSDIRVHGIVDLGGNKIFIAGLDYEGGYNMAVIDLADNYKIIKKINYEKSKPTLVRRVGNKILLGSHYGNGSGEINVVDIDNITLQGIRSIKGGSQLFSNDASFEVDKNGNVWTLSVTELWGPAWLTKIDMKNETCEHVLQINYSKGKSAAITLDNNGEFLFVRSHEAVYKLDTQNIPTELYDPYFEMMGSWTELKDLEMTKEGSLLVANKTTPGEVLEYTEEDGSWTLTSQTIVDSQPQVIILPNN